jgi:hypothetical protein
MMRSLSPFDVDGTVASFCGQLLAAGISLFLTRTVRRNWLLWVSHFATVPLAAVAACLMGFGGLVAADSLRQIGFTFGRIELIPNDAIIVGYDIGPILGTTVVLRSLCWYYKATHGGLSLLNFDTPSGESVDAPASR